MEILDAQRLLDRVAEEVAPELRPHVIVIGSIASAWHFRDQLGNGAVATKDIDLLLRPAIAAQATAADLGASLIAGGWTPRLTDGRQPGTRDTPVEELPALRLHPPGSSNGWFIELLAEPMQDQQNRREWRAFQTPRGYFGLPSFRRTPIAIHAPTLTPSGLKVANPANMALAHLLEHAEPDRTAIAGLPGAPQRFVKDVGRAICLAWLAFNDDPAAAETWPVKWRDALAANGVDVQEARDQAIAALTHLAPEIRQAHVLAEAGLLQARTPSLEAMRSAHVRLRTWVTDL